MSDSKDAALAAEGDYQAFERLYRRYFSRVYSLCARLSGSRERGTALMEEVFVKTWEDLHHFRGETPFAVWLDRLATDVVLSHGEMVDRNDATPELRSSATEHRDDLPGAAPVRGLNLSQAIDRLPADARGIFVLHDVEGYKHAEIAEIFGITVGGSKARLQRARVLLKEALGR